MTEDEQQKILEDAHQRWDVKPAFNYRGLTRGEKVPVDMDDIDPDRTCFCANTILFFSGEKVTIAENDEKKVISWNGNLIKAMRLFMEKRESFYCLNHEEKTEEIFDGRVIIHIVKVFKGEETEVRRYILLDK